MKVIAIANQKGGTAKTTTTATLGVLLARRGYRVHLVDMDPQASLTRAFGLSDSTDRLCNVMAQRAALPMEEIAPSLTLTPATVELSRTEIEIWSEPGREFFLRACLESSQLPEESIVLVDCPPSLGVLAVNCFTAAGGLIAVVQPGGFELHALVHLHVTIDTIRDRVNRDLRVLGAVITNAHMRRSMTGEVTAEVARVYPVLGTIRTDARLLSATSHGSLQRLTACRAMDDYGRVADQLQVILR